MNLFLSGFELYRSWNKSYKKINIFHFTNYIVKPHGAVYVSDFYLSARPPLKMEKYFKCSFDVLGHLE